MMYLELELEAYQHRSYLPGRGEEPTKQRLSGNSEISNREQNRR